MINVTKNSALQENLDIDILGEAHNGGLVPPSGLCVGAIHVATDKHDVNLRHHVIRLFCRDDGKFLAQECVIHSGKLFHIGADAYNSKEEALVRVGGLKLRAFKNRESVPVRSAGALPSELRCKNHEAGAYASSSAWDADSDGGWMCDEVPA